MPLLDQQGGKVEGWTRQKEPKAIDTASLLIPFSDFEAYNGRKAPLGIEITHVAF